MLVSEIFSHSYFDSEHFGKKRLDPGLRAKYEKCKYKLYIYLTSLEEMPRFNAVGIYLILKGKQPKFKIILPESYPDKIYIQDREGIGNFIFLLATKLTYDLLKKERKYAPDNAGFLHSWEIERLHKISGVPSTIYGQLKRLQRESKDFLKKILFEPDQMDHFICTHGPTGSRKGEENRLWWLNLSFDDIEYKFLNCPDKSIPKENLLGCLEKLFPQEHLLSNNEITELCNKYYELSDTDKSPVVVKKTNKNHFPLMKTPEDGRIRQFLEKLRQKAMERLMDKLHSEKRCDYIPLDLEIGLIAANKNNKDDDKIADSKLYNNRHDHNRKWQEFDCRQLENPKGIYILSSETGCGKTTFLRNLQLTLIDKGKIPLFLDADDLKGIDFRNGNQNNFLEGIAHLFKGYLDNGSETEFLISCFDKVILIIDGLDQDRGSGTEYKNLVDNLLTIRKTNLIIASRPFALINIEKYSDIIFLRLMPFSVIDQRRYFGDLHERAKKICNECPWMLSTPMLSFMVKILVESNDDRKIKNHADLFGRAIEHIIENHLSKHLVLDLDSMELMREMLGEISYKAITNEEPEPYSQRIPYIWAMERLQANGERYGIRVETLLKAGLPDTILKFSGESYIYFNHLSFQEYLAAKWLKNKPKELDSFLERFWKDTQWEKWKNILIFTIGPNGKDYFFNDIYLKLLTPIERSNHIDLDYLRFMKRCYTEIDLTNKDKDRLFNDIVKNILLHFEYRHKYMHVLDEDSGELASLEYFSVAEFFKKMELKSQDDIYLLLLKYVDPNYWNTEKSEVELSNELETGIFLFYMYYLGYSVTSEQKKELLQYAMQNRESNIFYETIYERLQSELY